MSWRGLSRALEREARAQQRLHAHRLRQENRVRAGIAKAVATAEAQAYAAEVEAFQQVHRSHLGAVDWRRVAAEPEPPPPQRGTFAEQSVRARIDGFQPTLLERVFGTKKRRAQLETDLTNACAEDLRQFGVAVHDHERAHRTWSYRTRVAAGVLAQDPRAYRDALDIHAAFSGVQGIGASAAVESTSATAVEIDLYATQEDVIPVESHSVTSTGKASVKKLTASAMNDLYQAFVCASALRVARDTLDVLPIERVYVHFITDMLNAATGHVETSPVLSVAITRGVLAKMNLNAADPVEAMRNFEHHMKFTRAKGFAPVEALSVSMQMSAVG